MHFSEKPLTAVHDCDPRGHSSYKPNGLWISAGMEWFDWCVDNEFMHDRMGYATMVHLAPDAKLIRLSTGGALTKFSDEYEVELFPDQKLAFGSLKFGGIDWPRVAETYDGILIEPYQYSRRMNLMWYYSWDVASGCIWNARAIASLAPSVPLPPIVPRESTA